MQPLDRSILNSWRSLDNMCFSSQFYFVVTLTTWGIVLLCLGTTAMIKNDYNPFADPVMILYAGGIVFASFPVKFILGVIANAFKFWRISIRSDNTKLDTGV